MERVAWGYTIIEVMIVLSITAVLFASAMLVFSGQRSSTGFSQAMQSVNSKIQEYANRVVTGSYPGSSNYSCSVSSTTGRAMLSSPPTGSGLTCLFLGLAIQALPAQSSLQAYTVLGDKDIYSGPQDTLSPVLTIDSAQPEPAITTISGNQTYVLTDNFTLDAGTTVLSSNAITTLGATLPNNSYDLVGFYNGLPGDSAASSSGTGALVLKAYACNSGNGCSSQPPQQSPQLKTCIEESNSTVCANSNIKQWNVCFKDGGSSNTALLKVKSAPGGITTQLNFVGCS
ncbi:MAG: type II secretion system protein [Candidatus Saccharimonadales bacterium]|jgi:type II secretory pathway pseudopilin PulG